MAPLPANETSVYFVDYSFQGHQHTAEFRVTDTTSPATAIPVVQAYLAALETLMVGSWTILGARFRAKNSTISLPAQAPTQPLVANVTLNDWQTPRFVSFVGRGKASGRRVRFYMYGLFFDTPQNYRLGANADQRFTNARLVLDNDGENILTTIAGDAFRLNAYENVGFNSYLERKLRT